ncbi:hypothetical protein HO173_003052 [Letharia columbiana]|uniref:Uncharacterized protein n=1 Tax=Letharia columbiana TaxID=112416 RepID=A0A8H6G158_9LECA|nr:uncharacterized protein HO173_003052 [Letharia columbiana]KAF6238547.1 hypothetical protein HO173_003052 [Letharia columbiana]
MPLDISWGLDRDEPEWDVWKTNADTLRLDTVVNNDEYACDFQTLNAPNPIPHRSASTFTSPTRSNGSSKPTASSQPHKPSTQPDNPLPSPSVQTWTTPTSETHNPYPVRPTSNATPWPSIGSALAQT